MDLKAPSSRESSQNNFLNLKYIKKTDDIKIVIHNINDFYWAEEIIKEKQITKKNNKTCNFATIIQSIPLTRTSRTHKKNQA